MYQMPKNKQNEFTKNQAVVVVPVVVREEDNGDIVKTDPTDGKRNFIYIKQKQTNLPPNKVNKLNISSGFYKPSLQPKSYQYVDKQKLSDSYYTITDEDRRSNCEGGKDVIPYNLGSFEDYINTGDWDSRDCPTTEYDLSNSKRIACYFSEWSIYNGLHLKQLAVEDYTDVYYSFAGIKGVQYSKIGSYNQESINRDLFSILIMDRNASLSSYQDSDDKYENNLRGTLAEIVRAKKKFPDKRFHLSIGGWTLSDSYPYIVNSICGRKKFIDNLITFLEEFRMFDGVDIDYEFPLKDGSKQGLHYGLTDEWKNFIFFISELKTALYKYDPTKELTITLTPSKDVLPYLDLRYISDIADNVNLMLYDFYGAWNNELGFNTMLYSASWLDPTRSVDFVLKLLDKKAVDISKLNIGIPAYGRGWQNIKNLNSLDDIKNNNVDTSEAIPLQNGTLGVSIPAPGYITFDEIKSKLESNDDLIVDVDGETQAAYIIDPNTGVFITYESEQSLDTKIQYLQNNYPDFRGVFYWEALGDKDYYLINQINKSYGNPTK